MNLFLLFVVSFALTLSFVNSEFEQEFYVKATRCNVTHDTSISTTRGVTYCGALCLGHSDCSGFRYTPLPSNDGGCRIYGGSRINSSTGCSQGDDDLTEIFVVQNLANAHNMTLRNNGSSSHGNENNVLTCENGGTYDAIQKKCNCVDGWIGSECESLTGDCTALKQSGKYSVNGIYKVHPSTSPAPFEVYCYLASSFGLTQVQAHLSAAHTFNRSWADYKLGFNYSEAMNDMWMGNDKIHYITTSRNYRFLLTINNGSINHQFTHYNFVMASEADNYAVTYDSVSTTLSHAVVACWNGSPALPFSTYDRDNDGNDDVNCAARHGAGWWFESTNNCTKCNVNGEIDPNQFIRQGKPEETFLLPIDPDFSPKYILMALYWTP